MTSDKPTLRAADGTGHHAQRSRDVEPGLRHAEFDAAWDFGPVAASKAIGVVSIGPEHVARWQSSWRRPLRTLHGRLGDRGWEHRHDVGLALSPQFLRDVLRLFHCGLGLVDQFFDHSGIWTLPPAVPGPVP